MAKKKTLREQVEELTEEKSQFIKQMNEMHDDKKVQNMRIEELEKELIAKQKAWDETIERIGIAHNLEEIADIINEGEEHE